MSIAAWDKLGVKFFAPVSEKPLSRQQY